VLIVIKTHWGVLRCGVEFIFLHYILVSRTSHRDEIRRFHCKKGVPTFGRQTFCKSRRNRHLWSRGRQCRRTCSTHCSAAICLVDDHINCTGRLSVCHTVIRDTSRSHIFLSTFSSQFCCSGWSKIGQVVWAANLLFFSALVTTDYI